MATRRPGLRTLLLAQVLLAAQGALWLALALTDRLGAPGIMVLAADVATLVVLYLSPHPPVRAREAPREDGGGS